VTRLVVLNVGSASLKAALYESSGSELREVARASLELAHGEPAEARLGEALARVGGSTGPVRAVGHRIVHGGSSFVAPTRIDAGVEAEIERLAPLAPLHQAPALRVVRAARRLLRDCEHVGVFDTAFHAKRSPASLRYALPDELTERLGLFRFGFHGIAHASLVEGLAEQMGAPAEEVRAVTLQLGQGCSACAVEAGRSIETSMGFTPLEGLVMGTRSGDVDPGVLLHLLRSGFDVDSLEDLLMQRSGLLGLAGTRDMRALLGAARAGDAHASRALDLFVHRTVLVVGAYLTLLGGNAALAFGGGIGENATEVRERVVRGLRAWGFELDPEANRRGTPGRISRPGAPAVHVVRTDEERVIARLTAHALERYRGRSAGF
jgi:acetate kinase